MLFSFVYDILLVIVSLIALPKLLYQMLFHKKYRKSLLQRLGFGFPSIDKKSRKLLWVHAVSMGETRAVAALVKRVKEKDPDIFVVTSSVTETGYHEAEKSMPMADAHVFLPFDFHWIVAPIINRVKPDVVILCETDFWYNFLKNCKGCKAKVFLVNGKLSERSLALYTKLPRFTKKLFSCVDRFCVQSHHYETRFKALGIPESKIVVTGNIKFDGSFPKLPEGELQTWRKSLGIPEGDYVIVAGSTHDPEEKLLLDTMKKVWHTVKNVTVVIVPRHPERFDEVAAVIQRGGIPFRRYSQLKNGDGKGKVILLDAMGLLRQCYQIADLALVAGSYTPKVGGHNITEPAWYGVPALFGPHMHAQPELVELVLRHQAGLQVPPDKLDSVIVRLLQNSSERQKLGDAGRKMVRDFSGATERTYQEIFINLKK